MTEHSSEEKLFVRVTGLSKGEWIHLKMQDHGLSSAAALGQYNELLRDIVKRRRKMQSEDEKLFNQAVAAMRGTDPD